MVDNKELLRRPGESIRRAARESGMDRKTVGRSEVAQACGLCAGGAVTEAVVAQVAQAVQKRTPTPPSDSWQALVPCKERIDAWLSRERPLRWVRVHD